MNKIHNEDKYYLAMNEIVITDGRKKKYKLY